MMLTYQSSLEQFGPRAAERYFTIMLNAAQFAADHRGRLPSVGRAQSRCM